MANYYEDSSIRLLSHSEKAARLGKFGEAVVPMFMTWFDPKTGVGFCTTAETMNVIDDADLVQAVIETLKDAGVQPNIHGDTLMSTIREIHELAPDLMNAKTVENAEKYLVDDPVAMYEIDDIVQVFKDEVGADLRGVDIDACFYCDRPRFGSAAGYATVLTDRLHRSIGTTGTRDRFREMDYALNKGDLKSVAWNVSFPFVGDILGIVDKEHRVPVAIEALGLAISRMPPLFGIPSNVVLEYIGYDLMEQANNLSCQTLSCEIPDE